MISKQSSDKTQRFVPAHILLLSNYPDTFKLWITALYTWKTKKTALYPLPQSRSWQSWKHNQGLLHVWADQLASFTRSVSEGHFWCEDDPVPTKGSLEQHCLACSYPADMETGLGMNSAFPSPSSWGFLPWDLFTLLHWRAQGGSIHGCWPSYINLQIRTATTEICTLIHILLGLRCPHCHQLACHQFTNGQCCQDDM